MQKQSEGGYLTGGELFKMIVKKWVTFFAVTHGYLILLFLLQFYGVYIFKDYYSMKIKITPTHEVTTLKLRSGPPISKNDPGL